MKTLQVVESIKRGKFDDQFLEIYADFKLVAYERARYIQAIQRYNIDFDAGSSYDIEIFSAPGRSEIGGNHTDHQQGEVLATSINRDAIAIVQKINRPVVTVLSDALNIHLLAKIAETYCCSQQSTFRPLFEYSIGSSSG